MKKIIASLNELTYARDNTVGLRENRKQYAEKTACSQDELDRIAEDHNDSLNNKVH